jgi:hypothetical protein
MMSFSLAGVGNHQLCEDRMTLVVDLQITSEDGAYSTLLTEVRVVDDIANDLHVPDWNKYLRNYKYLNHLKIPKPTNEGQIDILIGTDHPQLLVQQAVIEGGPKDPLAIRSRLGWTIAGKIHKREGNVLLGLDKTAKYSNPFAYHSTFNKKDNSNFLEQVKLGHKRRRYSPRPKSPKSNPDSGMKSDEVKIEKVMHDSSVSDADRDVLRNLTAQIKRYWDVDDFREDTSTKEEEDAFDILRSSYHINDEGKATVSCLWKKNQPNIKNNYFYGVARLNGLVDKMSTDLFLEIDNIFMAYVKDGTARVVEDTDPHVGDKWYWPHFSVIKRERETTPLRQVFDGKIGIINGKGINETCFMAGPTLLNDLSQVLMRFRRYDVAVIGDISKMFPNIRMLEKDRAYHRFLWKDKSKDKILILEFASHLFGNAGSPTCAIFCAMENARRHQKEFPRAAETVFHSTIIDDNADSVHSEEEAIKLVADLVTLYGKISLKIRKWASNRPAVVNSVPETERTKYMVDFQQEFEPDSLNDVSATSGKEPCNMKILGLVWLCKEDSFAFKVRKPGNREVCTKHSILSDSLKLYDPLGFLNPTTLEPRDILKEAWGEGLGWKDPVTSEMHKRWIKWCEDLVFLEKIRVPRVLIPGAKADIKKVELHAFADASKVAYAACVYTRVVNSKGVFTNLVMSRNRITPKNNKKTIPKLELLSIELASKIVLHCAKALQIPVSQITIWSDSKTAIQWLNMDSRTLQILVHNLSEKIQARLPVSQIRWVPGLKNPADVATRIKTAEELVASEIWFKGPKFLLEPELEWPKLDGLNQSSEEIAATMGEVKKEFKSQITLHAISVKPTVCVSQENKLSGSFFSSYSKNLRVAAYCWDWMRKVKSRIQLRKKGVEPKVLTLVKHKDIDFQTIYPSLESMKQAEIRLVYAHQQRCYPEAIMALEKRNSVPLSNKLSKLGPELCLEDITNLNGDSCDIKLLRLAGRLKLATHLSYNMRKPIVLHPSDPFAKLVIAHYHGTVLKHTGGIKCLMCELNRMYWIAGSMRSIKALITNCVKCRKLNARPTRQQMAPLPEFRIPSLGNRLVPFETTALDCAGPWEVKIARRVIRPKRYMLIFRCTLYGAIHIEMLTAMDTNCFLMALERFCAIRCKPRKIICDNGTNFVGADKVLKELWSEIDPIELQRCQPTIEFSFTPPLSPHFNGLIERMVQSAKKILKAILPENPYEETLQTCFAQTAAYLNNRPIGYSVSSSNDLEALTPNHFLGGGIHFEFCPISFTSGGNLAIRFRKLQQFLDEFWKRLCLEIAPYLRKYQKWLTKRTNLEKDDICVLLEPSERNKFPLCRVLETKLNEDGLVRSVLVRLKDNKAGFGTTQKWRGIQQLYVVLPATVPLMDDVSEDVMDDSLKVDVVKSVDVNSPELDVLKPIVHGSQSVLWQDPVPKMVQKIKKLAKPILNRKEIEKKNTNSDLNLLPAQDVLVKTGNIEEWQGRLRQRKRINYCYFSFSALGLNQ